MTTARDIRSWLMSQPRPTTIRLMLADGKVEELACAGQPWARLGESCAAMDPVTIWKIDAGGKVLGCSKTADLVGSEDDEVAAAGADAIAPPARMERDESRAMLAVLDKFGQLLAAAYQHATTTAFDQMVRVAELHSNATVSMQRELVNARIEVRRLERDMLQEAIDKAEEAGDGDMMRQFVGAYFSGQAERFAQQATNAVAGGTASGAAGNKPNGKAPPGKPNGKAPPPPPKGTA